MLPRLCERQFPFSSSLARAVCFTGAIWLARKQRKLEAVPTQPGNCHFWWNFVNIKQTPATNTNACRVIKVWNFDAACSCVHRKWECRSVPTTRGNQVNWIIRSILLMLIPSLDPSVVLILIQTDKYFGEKPFGKLSYLAVYNVLSNRVSAHQNHWSGRQEMRTTKSIFHQRYVYRAPTKGGFQHGCQMAIAGF